MADSAEAAARAVVDIFATGNLDAIPLAVAEDYVDHQGLGEIEIRGQEGFRQVVAAVRRHADVRVTIEDLVAERNRAADRLRWHGVDDAGRGVTRETLDLLHFVAGRFPGPMPIITPRPACER